MVWEYSGRRCSRHAPRSPPPAARRSSCRIGHSTAATALLLLFCPHPCLPFALGVYDARVLARFRRAKRDLTSLPFDWLLCSARGPTERTSKTRMARKRRAKVRARRMKRARKRVHSRSCARTASQKLRASSARDARTAKGAKTARTATPARDSGAPTANGGMIARSAAVVLMAASRGAPLSFTFTRACREKKPIRQHTQTHTLRDACMCLSCVSLVSLCL
jgi:hypothetical protein